MTCALGFDALNSGNDTVVVKADHEHRNDHCPQL